MASLGFDQPDPDITPFWAAVRRVRFVPMYALTVYYATMFQYPFLYTFNIFDA